jgi:phasin family protein
MTSTNPFSSFFSSNDFTKSFEHFQTMPFDLKDMMECHRKNLQAISEAQQLAFEGMQAVAQRQSEIVTQFIQDNSKLAQEMLTDGKPEDKMAKNAEIMKKIYDKTTVNFQELSDMVSKSSTETGKLLNKRVSASITELSSALDKGRKKAA